MANRRAHMNWGRVIRANSPQLFFVFAAFFLMVSVSYFSIGAIVRQQTVRGMEEAMLAAEANVRAGFSKSEATMAHAARIVQEMLSGGAPAPRDELLAYLTNTTGWMREDDQWGMRLSGIYGYFLDEFIDGAGLKPGRRFRPQARPWFDAAVRNPGEKTAYTEPYTDAKTGEIIMSSVRNIYDRAGNYLGILAIDMDLSWFKQFVRSFQRSDGGYGMILNQYLVVVGHPGEGIVGRQAREVCAGYREIHDALMARGEISALRVADIDGSAAVVSFRRMFNGWYIGVVAPYGAYYRSVYHTAAILSVLGIVLMGVLNVILLRLSAAQMRSEKESRSKSTFLARMSHEIRTPMNAIIGMSELAQRDYGTPKGLEYVAGIRSAGASLLAIINDVLDFSKVESGRLELDAAPYETASLLNDALTLIRVRMAGKPLELIVEADPGLPRTMIGDAGCVKQVLLNLLSNAVKYTEKGFIRLSVSRGGAEGKAARLSIVVADSGIGVKPEDMPKLFGGFTRIDQKRNSAIEGTGLGLSIARSLCRAMGGDITAASEYGRGSVFTATLVQDVADQRPMGDMAAAAAMSAVTQHISFTAPEAEVLVVDDFRSNLLVAEGLLAPYKMRVHTCLNGREAVELVKNRAFDLVLMDHMMPEMDGLEAVAAIRALGGPWAGLPIAALTANVVSGMKEMFLAGGFNDFLAKPIETAELDGLLRKWIPAAKKQPADGAAAPEDGAAETPLKIEGLDQAAGLARVGGAPGPYRALLQAFLRDVETGSALLETSPDAAGLPAFTTFVHALKSGLAAIGADVLSEAAAGLEKAGRRGDLDEIRDKLAPFRVELAALTGRLGSALAEARPGGAAGPEADSAAAWPEALAELRGALKARDVDGMDLALARLQELQLGREARAAVDGLARQVLFGDFKKAAEAVEALLARGEAPDKIIS